MQTEPLGRPSFESSITEPLPSTHVARNSSSSEPSVPNSPKGLARKPSIPAFPSLPAPIPFRKSIKAPPESLTAQLGAATPGGALALKRTSWLMKAREVKAREISIKKPTLPPPIVSSHKRKSGDMLGTPTAADAEEEERHSKIAKVSGEDVASLEPKVPESEMIDSESDDGLLVQLKKTVDGLGTRLGKSMGKSFGGGAAANALAEARAAAEARIAERHLREEEATTAMGEPAAAQSSSIPEPASDPPSHHRLSISELITSSESKTKATPGETANAMDHTEDKPVSSLPPVFHLVPGGPVFNKPVFAPAKAPTTTSIFKLPTTNPFSRPAPVSVGLGTRLPSPKPPSTAALSAQSTLESVRSDALFNSQDVPAWMPSTQETEYTSGFGSQSQCSPPRPTLNDLDEDDSWPLQERLAATSSWLANAKEDSLTWSTLPTSSTRRDTGFISQLVPTEDLDTGFLNDQDVDTQPIPGSFHMDVDDSDGEKSSESAVDEMDEMDDIGPGKSTVSLVDQNAGRSESQMSVASTTSSQSQGGFFGHATKLVNSMLGSSKKTKPEVKSLQLAAAAAKKEQEEKEKKANRLKEMENRRQAAQQRKVEEEKAKTQEEERKLKEENERRKKDREEFTDKRPLLKSVVAKKIPIEADKKPELKKAASKPNLNASTSTKVPVKSGLGKPLSALASSTTYNAASTSKPAESSKAAILQPKGKLAMKAAVIDDDIAQPSQILQTQMAARAKAQLQAANPSAPPQIASENIELPDINSEYSDSDDEDRPRSFNPPSWAQSPDLRQALEIQSTINPDDIFGAIRPLRMDELFRNRSGRFRARTSSANWTGTDRLTIEEQREYVRRMGYNNNG
ncbi:hypothetical protein C8F01DRAFT_411433 [Mycena amicta]|nr:hypothetical protein C8F01DRAFT_411433 [Mycena amicta]